MKRVLTPALALSIAILISVPAAAAPISDLEDSFWLASGSVDFEITFVSGSLASSGSLEFGLYNPSDLTEQIIFDNGYAFGDTATVAAAISAPFGFFLSNTGTAFGGPYTYYSDTSLNPAASDAMAATNLGGGTWQIEFEDLFLPLSPGFGDLRVTMSGARPLPEPGTITLLGLGLVGLGLARRRRLRLLSR